jgi:hypothetical protein
MDRTTAASAGILATLALVYGITILVVVAFMVWVYWRIFAKTGYSGALSLLNLIPGVGSLICVLILAFGRWPIEDELAALRTSGGGGVIPTMSPPGTSVMPT